MIKLNKINKPNTIFAEVIESGAIDQFINVMEHPAITKGALMPDAHQGYTMPIGAVVESKGMVFPSFVGYDIGCGMCAVHTTFKKADIEENATAIYKQIKRDVPVGFNKHAVPVDECDLLDMDANNSTPAMFAIFDEKKGYHQLGTLGGGNHFIEIGYDDIGDVWIIVHSGSRGVGHGCAQHYMKLASGTGKASEGCYGFDVNSDNGKDYIKDMNWCLEFALLNRMVMLRLIGDAIKRSVDGELGLDVINRNHNHAESKDGLHWIHRKGATHAEKGMMGVIPGNMRDGSFIVRGLGNEDALCSSSHGAGRVLGRKKAKETLDIEEFFVTMEGICANVGKGTLDESPMAYKDIFEVMRLQNDLVEVVNYVRPIINVKG